MGEYADAIRNNDRHKPPLSFGTEFLSEWNVSDRSLPIDVFTWSIFNLIGPLLRLFASTYT